MQGRKALKVEWDDSGFVFHDTPQLYAKMEEDLKTKEGLSARTKGNPTHALEKAEKKIEAIYSTPYESHSAMSNELRCNVTDDTCEIWGTDTSARLGSG
ncbi:MAG: hypothetical protein WDO15_16310 [Bacteroidota bacterium]